MFADMRRDLACPGGFYDGPRQRMAGGPGEPCRAVQDVRIKGAGHEFRLAEGQRPGLVEDQMIA